MTTTDVPPSVGSPVSEGWWVQDDQVAAMIDMHRLRELTAELGFMPATTDATDIERRGGAVAVATLIMGADYDAGWPSYESAKSDGSCPSVAEAVTVARPGVDAGPHIRGPHFRYEGRSGSDAGALAVGVRAPGGAVPWSGNPGGVLVYCGRDPWDAGPQAAVSAGSLRDALPARRLWWSRRCGAWSWRWRRLW
jgi:hypothetical protein